MIAPVAGKKYKPVQHLLAINRELAPRLGVKLDPAFKSVAAPKLSAWARRVVERIVATIFKPLLKLKPITKENVWFVLGALSGITDRVLLFWEHEAVPIMKRQLPPDLYGNPKALAATLGNDLLTPAYRKMLGLGRQNRTSVTKAAGELFCAQLASAKIVTDQFYALALSSGTKSYYLYKKGSQYGISAFLTENGEFAGDKGRFALYQELLAAMPVIEKMRLAKPRKTRRDLHEMITAELGQNIVGDYKRFCAICDDIGLVLSPRGRPPSSINTKLRVC